MDGDKELQEAISEIKQGNKEKARELVRNFIKTNPNNEMAWWIYAKIAENIEQRVYCLEKVVEINPNYKNAKEQLQIDQKKIGKIPSSTPRLKDTQDSSKKKSNPLLPAMIILSIIVLGLAVYIVYSDFIQPQRTNLLQQTDGQIRSQDESTPQNNVDPYETQLIAKLESINDAAILWELKLAEELNIPKHTDIKSNRDLFDDMMLTKNVGDQQNSLIMVSYTYFEFENELFKIAEIAKLLADAYLEAEVALGGYDPDVENKIPYEKVLSCLGARSLYYNYIYQLFRGDIDKTLPEFDPNSCDRYESYYDLFVSGLAK